MSSAYGQVDPNRVALNQNARLAQQQAQQKAQQAQARQDELDRQAELDAQKEEDKRIAAIREANSRVANDPLAQQGRFNADVQDALKTGRTIKTLQEMGYDIDSISFEGSRSVPTNIKGFKNIPVEAPKPTIDYAAETAQDFALFRQVEKENPNLIGLNVTRNYGPANNPSAFPLQTQVLASYQTRREQAPRYDVSEADVIGRLAGGARAAGTGTEFGYSIAKDKSGNVTDVEQSLFFTPGVKVSGEALSRNYEVFKQKQIESANFGPTAYVRNFPIKYDVSLQDSLSGQSVKGSGPVKYDVNLSDAVGVSDKSVAIPNSPLTGLVYAAQNQVDDFLLGAFGSGVGIGSIFTGLAGKPLSKSTQESVESRGQQTIASERPELFKGAIDVGIQQASGKPGGANDFLSSLSSAPLFFAGSAGFTALTFATPGSIGKGVGFAARGLGTAVREAPRAASELGSVIQAGTRATVRVFPNGVNLLEKTDSAAARLASGLDVLSENVGKAGRPINAAITEVKYGVRGLGESVSTRLEEAKAVGNLYGSATRDVVEGGISRVQGAIPTTITQSRPVAELSLLPTRITAGLKYDVPEAISSFPLTRTVQNLPDAFSEFYSGTSRGVAQGLRSLDTRARLAAFDAVYPIAQGINARKTEAEYLAYIGRERIRESLPSLDAYAVFNTANRVSKPLQPIGQGVEALSYYTSRGVSRTKQEVESLFADTVQDFGDVKERFVYDFSTRVAQPVKGQLKAEYNEALAVGKFLGGPIKNQLGAEYNEALALGKFLGGPVRKAAGKYALTYDIEKFGIDQRRAQGGISKNVSRRGFFIEAAAQESNIQPKTSFTPLSNINMQLIDKEFKAASKPNTTRAISESVPVEIGKFIGLGGNAKGYTSSRGLGFGGATGVERKGQNNTVFVSSEEDVIVKYPPGVDFNRPMRNTQRTGVDAFLGFGSGGKLEPESDLLGGLKPSLAFKGMEGIESRSGFKPISLIGTQPRQRAETAPESAFMPLSITETQSRQATLQGTKEALKQLTKQETIPKPRPPNRPVFEFMLLGAGPESKKSRKKGRRLKAGELVFQATEIFPNSPLSKMFKIE